MRRNSVVATFEVKATAVVEVVELSRQMVTRCQVGRWRTCSRERAGVHPRCLLRFSLRCVGTQHFETVVDQGCGTVVFQNW